MDSKVDKDPNTADGEVELDHTDDKSALSLDGPKSVDTYINLIGYGRFQVGILLFAGLVWITDAMEIMLLSFLAPSLHCSWDLNDLEKAMLTTAVFLGMMVGATLWGRVSDKFGRKKGMLAANIVVFCAGLASAFSPNYWTMLVLRTLVGFGVSGGHVAVSWMSEFTETKFRGKSQMFLEVFFALGAVIEACLAWVTLDFLGQDAWRYLLGLSTAPVVIVLLAIFFIPESPRWLILNGRNEEAKKVLVRMKEINKSNINIGEFEKTGNSHSINVKGLLSKKMRRTTILLWILWLVSAFFYYGMVMLVVEIYKLEDSGARCSGMHFVDNSTLDNNDQSCSPIPSDRYIDVVITSAAELPGLILSMLIIDYVGRRFALAFNFGLCGALVLVLIICLPRIAETAIMFIIRALIAGAFQVIYVYTPEVYPTVLRASGLGVCSSLARIGGMVTPFVATVLTRVPSVGMQASLGLYGITGLIAAICAFFLPIETLGRPLEDHLEDSYELEDMKKSDHKHFAINTDLSDDSESIKLDDASHTSNEDKQN